jgi:flotillin
MAEAEASRAKGLSEAQVIAAKGQAEADAMSKKAEAYKQYNDAAIANMIIDKLPELVAAAASPLSKVGNITLLSTNGDSGASKISGDVISIAAQSLMMVKSLTGVDLTDTLRRKMGGPGASGGEHPPNHNNNPPQLQAQQAQQAPPAQPAGTIPPRQNNN